MHMKDLMRNMKDDKSLKILPHTLSELFGFVLGGVVLIVRGLRACRAVSSMNH